MTDKTANPFALTPEDIAELAPRQKKSSPSKPASRSARRSQTKFIMLPYEQTLAAAGRLGNAPLAVLVELAHQVFKTHQNTVPLTNAALRSVGISRHAKLHALCQLEEVGVIAVSWREKRSPLVTVLW
jgi:hypothetical protein